MMDSAVPMPTADQALERLMTGNRRYVSSKQEHPHQTTKRRAELREGQHPFAVILGCSDSRVPPELIFDQGLGDLFVVRVAGNILDDVVLGSIEYAAAHLHTPLIMVLGHSKCGAVSAAASGHPVEGHLSSITAALQPALNRVKDQPGDRLDHAVKAHVSIVAGRLRSSKPLLAGLVETGSLKVVAAYYGIDTGEVEVLPCPPVPDTVFRQPSVYRILGFKVEGSD